MMSGSPEMLFPDDIDDSPLPARPVAIRRSAVAPSDRRMDWSPGVPPRGFRAEHVAIPVRPIVPSVFVPRARVGPPIPGFYDPSGKKLRTSPSAFRLNPDSTVKSPLRKGEGPVRAQGPYMPGFDNPTRRVERREPAVSLNVDSEVTSPLRSTKKAGRRRRFTRRKARRYRSRKALLPSTRHSLRR